jgi:hypothetical protein
MIQIIKRRQIVQVGSEFSLSGLSQEERSRIGSIVTTSDGPPLSWRPDSLFNPFLVLSPGKSYMVLSVWPGGPFVPYSIPADAGATPEQNDLIENSYQFLTYRREQEFGLAGLSQEVKSKIKRMWADGFLPEDDFLNWSPDSGSNSFESFVPGSTYLIASEYEGFAPYDLGLPEAAEPSSSPSSAEPSSSSSSSPPCGQEFDTTLTAVLGAGVSEGLPEEFYYVSTVGMSFVSGAPATLQYNDLGPAGLSISTDISIGGEIVAGIAPGGDYTGRPFAFTYGGVTYCGTFVDGLVSF